MTHFASDRDAGPGPHQPVAQGVAALVLPVLNQGETPGVVVGWQERQGAPQFYAAGRGETGGGALGPDTLFPIGSLNKGFVGALLAVLIDEGRLLWDDRLGALLPEGRQLSPDAQRLTLLQLATHSAGLPRQPYELGLLLGLARFTFNGENFYNHFDRPTLMRYLAGFRAPADPKPLYSNIGYALIGMAIEARMGEALPALLQRKVLTPLGLHNTGYDPTVLRSAAHRAQGHAGDQPKFMRRGRPVPDWQFVEALHGAAGLYSSASDLLRFANAHLCRPGAASGAEACPTRLHALLADNLRVRIAQPQDAPGIAWVTDRVGELDLTNQVGMAVGHTSYVGIDPLHGRVAVVLQTSFNWNFKIGHVLLQRWARGEWFSPSDSPWPGG